MKTNFLRYFILFLGMTLVFGLKSRAEFTSKPYAGTVTIPVGKATSGLLRWSNPASWIGGSVPTAGADVMIPYNSTIVVDQSISVKSLTITGKLVVDPTKNISITANYIMIMGTGSYMEWGEPANPYTKTGVLTLTGQRTDPLLNHGAHPVNTKLLMVMSGGRLEMHGIQKTAWVKLNATALAGTNKLVLDKPVNWKVGDEIIITTTELETNFDKKLPVSQTEKRKITLISVDKKNITLDSTLKYRHYGELQTFSNASRSWVLDERAEVALLTHNLKIQGDGSSSQSQYGGHVMVMEKGTAHVSGIEFYKMGQMGILARYPFHWHLAKDVSGQYIRNCSVHESFNRAVTVHGSQNATVQSNVCYNILGHGIFLEDAVETGNLIDGNLVSVLNKPSNPILPSDVFLQGNRVEGPAAFWISHPSNTITNNVASSAGSGFWYALGDYSSGPSFSTAVRPNRAPLTKFSNNSAHACYTGLEIDFVDARDAKGALALNDKGKPYVINAHYFAPANTKFENFTGFKNYRGIWYRGENVEFSEFKLADNVGRGQFVATFNAIFSNGLVVGHSKNNVAPINFTSYATSIYDGNETIRGVHFENFDQPNQSMFTIFGGAQKHMPLKTSGISVKNCNVLNPEISDEWSPFSSFIEDQDGSLLGSAGAWASVGHPFIIDNQNFTQIQPGFLGYKTNKHFSRLRFELNPYEKQILYQEYADEHIAHAKPAGFYYDIPLMIGANRTYGFRFAEFIPAKFSLFYQQGKQGDQSYFILKGIPTELNVTPVRGTITRLTSVAAVKASSTNAYCFVNGEMHFNLHIEAAPNNDIRLELTTKTGNNLKPLSLPSRPFKNKAGAVNSTIQFEHYDNGGQEVGYHENVYTNSNPTANLLNNQSFINSDHRGQRWGEIVDVVKLNTTNYSIASITKGEWWKYTVTIPSDGNYSFTINGSSAALVNSLDVFFGNDSLGRINMVGTTGGGYTTVTTKEFPLKKGTHFIRFKAATNGMLLDWFKINPSITTPVANKAPLVALTSPAANSTFNAPATVTLAATASDLDGSIAKVEFYNGTTLLFSDVTAPYAYTWSNVGAGTYSIQAKAFDNKGATTLSTPTSIKVSAPVVNKAPIVALTSPAANSTFNAPATITLAASASDADGTIAKVEFYNGTTLLFSDVTAPYSYTWSNVVSGTYSIQAKAFDNKGATTLSTPTSIQVSAPVVNKAPVVALTSPATNSTFNAPATLTMVASASDADGTIAKVEFYNGTTLLFADVTAPYSYSWSNVVAGTYSIRAKAIDNKGASATSATTTIQVNDPISAAPISGPSCVTTGLVANYLVAPNLRQNVTSYGWWYSGGVATVVQNPDAPWNATFTFGAFTGTGEICAGLSYSVSPYYQQICIPITACAGKLSNPMETMNALAPISKNITVAPNPFDNTIKITATTNVEKILLYDVLGNILLNLNGMNEGSTMDIGENLKPGSYILKGINSDGSITTQSIQKIK